jgi:hypothetical protein
MVALVQQPHPASGDKNESIEKHEGLGALAEQFQSPRKQGLQ